MNKLELIITEEAFADIDEISKFIAYDNVNAAKKFVDLLFDSFRMLSEFPDMGIHKKGIQPKDIKIFIVKKKYLIAYRVKDNYLIIFKVSSRYQDIYKML